MIIKMPHSGISNENNDVKFIYEQGSFGKARIKMHLKGLKKSIILIALSILLIGCNNSGSDASNNVEVENNTEVIGSLSHGMTDYTIDSDDGYAFVTYNGGELHLLYYASALGMTTKGLGFMIFVDGVAQQYRVGDEMDYQYMHTFYLEDHEEYILSFYFVPTIGKAGDERELCIASIYYPDYMPDMIESEGYGIYHDMIESVYIIKYKGTPLEIDSPISSPTSLSLVTIQEADPDTGNENDPMRSKSIAASLFLNHQDVTLGNFYTVGDKDSIHIRLEITGHPIAEYGCIFYINHQPVSGNIEYIRTRQDKITILEADIDLSDIEKPATFYAILVPRNATQISDANIGLVKVNSVLLIN